MPRSSAPIPTVGPPWKPTSTPGAGSGRTPPGRTSNRNSIGASITSGPRVLPDTDSAPACPTCGHPLQARGDHDRTLVTDGGEAIALTRSYQTCPVCGTGLFPP